VNGELFELLNEIEVGAGYKPVRVHTKLGGAILEEYKKPKGIKIESGDFNDVK